MLDLTPTKEGRLRCYIEQRLRKAGKFTVERAQELLRRVLAEAKDVGTFKGKTGREGASDRLATLSAAQLRKIDTRGHYEKRLNKQLNLSQSRMFRALKFYQKQKKPTPSQKKHLKKVMTDELVKVYSTAYQFGILSTGIKKVAKGKALELSTEEKRWIKSALREEMKYFNKFFKELVVNKSRGNAFRRIHSYLLSSKSIFEAARARTFPPQTIVHWRLHPAEHCPSCLALAKYSPYTVNNLLTTPRAGRTLCLFNCKCDLRYQKVSLDKMNQVEKRNNRTRRFLLRKLRKK